MTELKISKTSIVESVGSRSNWAIISISLKKLNVVEKNWFAVHHSYRNKSKKPKYISDHSLLDTDDCYNIILFVQDVAPFAEGIVVCCEDGISYSAPVAEWIHKSYNLPYDYENVLFHLDVSDRMKEAEKQYRFIHGGSVMSTLNPYNKFNILLNKKI